MWRGMMLRRKKRSRGSALADEVLEAPVEAAMTRVEGHGLIGPERSNFLGHGLTSLAWVRKLMSPISSRKRVPRRPGGSAFLSLTAWADPP
jgi:hypothetical protein